MSGWVGTHPQWAASASADPLVIEAEGPRYPGEPIRGDFEDEHEQWLESAAEDPLSACSCSRPHPTGCTKTTSAAPPRTASSFRTAAPTGCSPPRPRCPSCPTSTRSSATADSPGARSLTTNGN